MVYRILTKNGIDNTNIDGARDQHFNAGMRDGIVKGALNEGRFVTLASNVISLDTCELRISGHRVVIDEAWSKTFHTPPVTPMRKAVIAQITVDDNSNVEFDLFDQDATTPLKRDNLFKTQNGAGVYQVEIGRFTLKTDSTIDDVQRTLDVITGGAGDVQSKIKIRNANAYKINVNLDPEFDVDTEYDPEDETTYVDVNLGLPVDLDEAVNQMIEDAVNNSNTALTTAKETNKIAQTAAAKASDAYKLADDGITMANEALNQIVETNDKKADKEELAVYSLSAEPDNDGRISFSDIVGINANRDNIKTGQLFVSPSGVMYIFNRFSSSTSSTYFYAAKYPERTIVVKQFAYTNQQTITTSKSELIFLGGDTHISFLSHGRPLLIIGSIDITLNGGNFYIEPMIDGVRLGSNTTNKTGVFSFVYPEANLTAGTHDIYFLGNTNTGTCVLNNYGATNVAVIEL